MRRRRRRRGEDVLVLQKTGIFDVKAERVETESNEARAIELEAQVFEAERARAIHIWRENALKAKLAEAEEREKSNEIEREEHVRFMGWKLGKVKEFRAKHEVEVHEMET